MVDKESIRVLSRPRARWKNWKGNRRQEARKRRQSWSG